MKTKNAFILLLTAAIWGVAFVAQSEAADHIGAFTFNSIRALLGAVVLLPVIFFLKKHKTINKTAIKGGVLCGIFLFIASMFQQYGIERSTVGKAGFLTALYIVLVPIVSIIGSAVSKLFNKDGEREEDSRRKITIWIGLSVLLALAGLYFLCIKEGFRLEFGDLLLIICAFCFTGQILVIDRYTTTCDGVVLACIEFFTMFVLAFPGMFMVDKVNLIDVKNAALPLLYTGVGSCGIAYTLQMIGQKDSNPTIASLIMSFESVISAIAGWLILGQVLSGREILGCVLMFAAIILSVLS